MLHRVTNGARRRNTDTRALSKASGCLFLWLMVGGCATQSVGELPLLQETINAQCAGGSMKECRVWGGNKFNKRYEYCGCREL